MSTDTLAVSDTDLEAMFSQDIPCSMCKKPATLMSRGHRCRPPGFRIFKCEPCHTAWAVHTETQIMVGKAIHASCGAAIHTVEELAEYHPM